MYWFETKTIKTASPVNWYLASEAFFVETVDFDFCRNCRLWNKDNFIGACSVESRCSDFKLTCQMLTIYCSKTCWLAKIRKCLSAPQLWCGLEIIRTTVVVRIRNYPHPSNISGLVWFGFGEPLNFQTSNITGEAWAQYIELFQIFSCLARNSLTECLCFGENFSLGRFRAPQTQKNMTGGGRGGVGEFQFGKV